MSNVFFTPSRTFADILRSARWYAPMMVMVAMGLAMVVFAAQKIGWEQIQENQVRISSASQREQFEKATPQQRQMGLKITKVISYVVPTVFIPVFHIIVALILWGTFNMAAGARLTFHQSTAIVMYASLIYIVKTLLALVALFAGVDPENFYFQNPVGTNLGYYMNVDEANPFLYSLATAIDPITIWILALTAIGFSIVGRVKSATAYAIVFGWWAVVTLVGAGFAAAFR